MKFSQIFFFENFKMVRDKYDDPEIDRQLRALRTDYANCWYFASGSFELWYSYVKEELLKIENSRTKGVPQFL